LVLFTTVRTKLVYQTTAQELNFISTCSRGDSSRELKVKLLIYACFIVLALCHLLITSVASYGWMMQGISPRGLLSLCLICVAPFVAVMTCFHFWRSNQPQQTKSSAVISILLCFVSALAIYKNSYYFSPSSYAHLILQISISAFVFFEQRQLDKKQIETGEK
jgi:hypothetical protein